MYIGAIRGLISKFTNYIITNF